MEIISKRAYVFKAVKENTDINIEKRKNISTVAFLLGWGGGGGLNHNKSMSSTLNNRRKHPNA